MPPCFSLVFFTLLPTLLVNTPKPLPKVLAEITSDAVWQPHVAEVVYQKIYKDFLEAIDGIDNGVEIAGGAELKYRVTTDLSARVGRLFPAWNEEQPNELVNECFRDAVKLYTFFLL